MKITDIAKALAPNAEQKIVGIRPGEKLHEQMIGLDDAPYTFEYSEHYKILPAINNWNEDQKRIDGGVLVDSDFTYSSDTNTDWMTIDTLQRWIKQNSEKIGTV